MLRAANENGGAALGAYAYYADGARKSKTAGGATSVFYYTGDQEIAEYAGATLTRRYVRLPGSVDEPLLMIDYTLDAACTNASAANCERWAHQNRLGSVVAVSDAAGAVVEKYTYSAYGESGNEGDGGFPFRFTGQKLDAETGLYYYKARYYDPETGRFLQTDPIGYRDQMNLYAYVGNDPVNATGPTGEYIEADFEAASLTLGVNSLNNNIQAGNTGAAVVDAIGIVADVILAAVPISPGVVGAGIQIMLSEAAQIRQIDLQTAVA